MPPSPARSGVALLISIGKEVESKMNEKEVAEIRRRFRPQQTNITKIRGCYVNGRDTAWAAGTSQAAVHSKWSLAGAKYDDDIATYNGRYLIACTTTYGRVGDKVDFTLSDGTVIKCVIADAKNPNDQGCNKWGHSNGQNVIEFEVERSRFYRSGNPGSSSWKAEWGGKRVCSSVNSGSIL